MRPAAVPSWRGRWNARRRWLRDLRPRSYTSAARARPHRPLVGYARRTPETTALYRTVQSHVPAMLAQARAQTAHGFGLPRFLQREFERRLGCGILGHGFGGWLRCLRTRDPGRLLA